MSNIIIDINERVVEDEIHYANELRKLVSSGPINLQEVGKNVSGMRGFTRWSSLMVYLNVSSLLFIENLEWFEERRSILVANALSMPVLMFFVSHFESLINLKVLVLCQKLMCMTSDKHDVIQTELIKQYDEIQWTINYHVFDNKIFFCGLFLILGVIIHIPFQLLAILNPYLEWLVSIPVICILIACYFVLRSKYRVFKTYINAITPMLEILPKHERTQALNRYLVVSNYFYDRSWCEIRTDKSESNK